MEKVKLQELVGGALQEKFSKASDDNAERVEWQSKACEKAVNAWNMNYKGER